MKHIYPSHSDFINITIERNIMVDIFGHKKRALHDKAVNPLIRRA